MNGGFAEGAGFAAGAAAQGECADDTRGQGGVSGEAVNSRRESSSVGARADLVERTEGSLARVKP